MTKRGKFITFEGGEGVGKTTQVSILKKYLQERQINTIATREPGGTIVAEEIRNIILGDTLSNDTKEYDKNNCLSVEGTKANDTRLDQITEVFLLSAARRDHVKKIIAPALEKGDWVISNRFFDSTYAYQTIGENILDLEMLEMLQGIATDSLKPDLTIVLDMPASESLGRVVLRNNKKDKFDMLGLDFHNQVRDNFLKIAKLNSDRCRILDASMSMEEVTEQIVELVEGFEGEIKTAI